MPNLVVAGPGIKSIAHAFWDNVIQKFVNEHIIPIKMAFHWHEGLLVYRFNS